MSGSILNVASGSNPFITQGTLNRLRGSVTIPNYPELNVANGYLDKEGISIEFQGETTLQIQTLTGIVPSPEPYQMSSVTINLIKTQGLAAVYETQRLLTSLVGPVTVVTDASTMPTYTFLNCSIQSVRPLKLNGTEVSYIVMITGYYPINSTLWSLT